MNRGYDDRMSPSESRRAPGNWTTCHADGDEQDGDFYKLQRVHVRVETISHQRRKPRKRGRGEAGRALSTGETGEA